MATKNTDTAYGSIARAFHWGMFIILTILVIVGKYMHGLEVETPDEVSFKISLYEYHKSFGILILLLVIARLAWRMKNPVPKLPGSMSRIESLSAHAMHMLLYLIMLVQPMVGWLMSSYEGREVKFFGILLPALADKDKEIGHFLEETHEFIATLLIVAFVIHVAASLYHHFIRKDDVLSRMLFSSDKSQ